MDGSPIKALVIKKKAVHPRFFLRVCLARWSVRSQSQFVPEISWSDSGPAIEAIRSVTHLVLALRRATLRTERNPRVAPVEFPPARFLGQPLLMPVARQCQWLRACPPPRWRRPENIQCRPVFIQFTRTLAGRVGTRPPTRQGLTVLLKGDLEQ